MPEARLFITWGQPVQGREKRANEQLKESVRYWKRPEDDGEIERSTDPHPGTAAPRAVGVDHLVGLSLNEGGMTAVAQAAGAEADAGEVIQELLPEHGPPD